MRRLIDRTAETDEFHRAGIVAIDITEADPFTGNRTGHEDETIGTKEDSYEYTYQWATVQLVGNAVPLVLDARPVTKGESRKEIVEDLLETAQDRVLVDEVLMDREFDSQQVLEAIENRGLNYVVPKRMQVSEKAQARRLLRSDTDRYVTDRNLHLGDNEWHETTLLFICPTAPPLTMPDYEKVTVEELPDAPNPTSHKKEVDEAVGATEFGFNLYIAEPGQRFPWGYHHHPDHEELFYVLDGELKVETPDSVVEVGTGEALFVPPNAPNKAVAVGSGPVRVVAVGAPKDSDGAVIADECPACGEETAHDYEAEGNEYVLSCAACGEKVDRIVPGPD